MSQTKWERERDGGKGQKLGWFEDSLLLTRQGVGMHLALPRSPFSWKWKRESSGTDDYICIYNAHAILKTCKENLITLYILFLPFPSHINPLVNFLLAAWNFKSHSPGKWNRVFAVQRSVEHLVDVGDSCLTMRWRLKGNMMIGVYLYICLFLHNKLCRG